MEREGDHCDSDHQGIDDHCEDANCTLHSIVFIHRERRDGR